MSIPCTFQEGNGQLNGTSDLNEYIVVCTCNVLVGTMLQLIGWLGSTLTKMHLEAMYTAYNDNVLVA